MPTINIVFRGLLVLNKHHVDGDPSMEIGILAVHEHGPDPSQHHTPRIMTFRNGVREETMVLKLDRKPKVWKLVVDDPVSKGITLREHGAGPIDRMASTTPDDDFRWVTNLENKDFPYGDIDQNFGLDRTDVKRVMQITSGQFYTRLKSPPLRRREIGNNNPPVDFGSLAGVMGLEIQVNSGGAKLIGENANDVIFTFKSDANIMYEIANSPADTVDTAPDHFPHYYEIFTKQPAQKFTFFRKPAGPTPNPPAPNPALCGKAYLGEFGGSLESMIDDAADNTATPVSEPNGHAHSESGAVEDEKATAAS